MLPTFCVFHFGESIPQIITWDPRLALATVTNAKFDKCLCLCGLLCRSFCGVNKGTHARAPYNPLGNTLHAYVREGNQLCCRTLGFKVSDQKSKQGTWYVGTTMPSCCIEKWKGKSDDPNPFWFHLVRPNTKQEKTYIDLFTFTNEFYKCKLHTWSHL